MGLIVAPFPPGSTNPVSDVTAFYTQLAGYTRQAFRLQFRVEQPPGKSDARFADVLEKVSWMVEYYAADPARAKLHCKCKSYAQKGSGAGDGETEGL